MLIVTEPAADLQILTPAELRVAIGLEDDDTSQDARLASLGLAAASSLAAAVGYRRAAYDASLAADSPPLTGAAPLTLKRESLVETIRMPWMTSYRTVFLGRWPVHQIVSVSEMGSALVTSDWEVDAPYGALFRISGTAVTTWGSGALVVTYDAGWDTVPEDLKGFASSLVNSYYLSSGDDPSAKTEEAPGVYSISRWVDSDADRVVPKEITTGLVRAGYKRGSGMVA